MRKKNLLIVNDSGLSGGGAEERLLLLINRLKREKYFSSIHFLSLRDSDAGSVEGVLFHSFASLKKKRKEFISKLILENSVDIVQLHNVDQLVSFVMPVVKKHKIPSIWFSHDYWALCAKRSMCDPLSYDEKICEKSEIIKCSKCSGMRNYLHLLKVRNLLNQADVGIAQGEKVKNIFEKNNVLKNRWKVVVPWIDSGFYFENKTALRNKDILFVGALTPYKGAHIAVKAFKRISKVFSGTRLILAGANQEKGTKFRNYIEDIAEKDKILDNIVFAGLKSKKQLRELYKKSLLLIFASIWQEPFGLVWAESMISGLPVIAYDIGGISEYLKNYGMLFKSGDHQELADKAIFLISERDFYKKLSIKSKKYAAEKFSVDNAFKEMIRIYERI